MICPSEDALAAFVDGELDDDERGAITDHVDQCRACHALLRDFARAFVDEGDTVGVARPAGAGLAEGDRVGRYVVERCLGAGGMGVVYLARDPEMDRQVALKLVRGAGDAPAAQRARLQREARALARLAHPNVVAAYDVGTHDDQLFIAMEHVDGVTLGEWLRGDVDLDACLQMFIQAGRGLEAAHREGLVHRDFKPGNVLVGREGRVRVVDFGLARTGEGVGRPPTDAASSVDTKTGSIAGTPSYMAPEQIAEGRATERSDQFSFCVALYEALYGERPFAGETFAELAQSIVSGSLSQAKSRWRIPARLRRAVRKGLAHDPDRRHVSMSALLEELEASRRTTSRHVLGLAVLATAAIVALVVVGSATSARRVRPDARAPLQVAPPTLLAASSATARSALSTAPEAPAAPRPRPVPQPQPTERSTLDPFADRK